MSDKTALENTADQISELVAPGESLWEYPDQLYRMVETRINELEKSKADLVKQSERQLARIACLESQLRADRATTKFSYGEGWWDW